MKIAGRFGAHSVSCSTTRVRHSEGGARTARCTACRMSVLSLSWKPSQQSLCIAALMHVACLLFDTRAFVQSPVSPPERGPLLTPASTSKASANLLARLEGLELLSWRSNVKLHIASARDTCYHPPVSDRYHALAGRKPCQDCTEYWWCDPFLKDTILHREKYPNHKRKPNLASSSAIAPAMLHFLLMVSYKLMLVR